MLWIETKTNDDARSLNEATWGVVSTKEAAGTTVWRVPGPALEDGRFWADAITELKDDPAARYAMARRHLPLPAAWREIAIALRAIIRQARKNGTEYEEKLLELHRLAAISSFADYGMIERIPFSRLSSLRLEYEWVGCAALPLLGKTDLGWMTTCWGYVDKHTTARILYSDLYELERKRIIAEDEARKIERIERLFENTKLPLDASPEKLEK